MSQAVRKAGQAGRQAERQTVSLGIGRVVIAGFSPTQPLSSSWTLGGESRSRRKWGSGRGRIEEEDEEEVEREKQKEE